MPTEGSSKKKTLGESEDPLKSVKVHSGDFFLLFCFFLLLLFFDSRIVAHGIIFTIIPPNHGELTVQMPC